jgi:SAM-dependent methyltransferase
VTDSSLPSPAPDTAGRVLAAFDVEWKIPRTLEALGPVADRDVVLLDAGRGHLAIRLAALGARLTLVDRPGSDPAPDGVRAGLPPGVAVVAGDPAATGLPDASADAIVVAHSAFRGPSPDEVVEADRVLRDGGRLLVVHDYGRDDHVLIRPEIAADTLAWSRRDGWFLTNGFRVRVLHCFWTFTDLDEAREVLELAFGPAGATFADGLTRPRVSHNVAVYHRSRHGSGPSPVERSREGPARHRRSAGETA